MSLVEFFLLTVVIILFTVQASILRASRSSSIHEVFDGLWYNLPRLLSSRCRAEEVGVGAGVFLRPEDLALAATGMLDYSPSSWKVTVAVIVITSSVGSSSVDVLLMGSYLFEC